MFITKDQVKLMHTLLSQTSLMEYKRDMIYDASGGRTTSSLELLSSEAQSIIDHLKKLDPKQAGAEKMRRRIISMAHVMQWHLPNSTKVDMMLINNWCLKYSYAKKPLNSYSYEELPKLVTQFSCVYTSFLDSLNS
jgi:hypothetical protein